MEHKVQCHPTYSIEIDLKGRASYDIFNPGKRKNQKNQVKTTRKGKTV